MFERLRRFQTNACPELDEVSPKPATQPWLFILRPLEKLPPERTPAGVTENVREPAESRCTKQANRIIPPIIRMIGTVPQGCDEDNIVLTGIAGCDGKWQQLLCR
jgi:hypothetical protein